MANICKKYVFWMSEKIEGFSRRWVLWRILKFLDFFSCYRFFLETVTFLWEGFTHNFVTIASKIEQSSHGKHLRTSKSVSNLHGSINRGTMKIVQTLFRLSFVTLCHVCRWLSLCFRSPNTLLGCLERMAFPASPFRTYARPPSMVTGTDSPDWRS